MLEITYGQTPHIIPLDSAFKKAVEISSIAYVGDSLYMPAAKCGLVFIGKVDGATFRFRTVQMKKRDYEGLSYCNGYFYLSHDSKTKIYKYNRAFGQVGSYSIMLRSGDENFNKEKIKVLKELQ